MDRTVGAGVVLAVAHCYIPVPRSWSSIDVSLTQQQQQQQSDEQRRYALLTTVHTIHHDVHRSILLNLQEIIHRLQRLRRLRHKPIGHREGEAVDER